MSFIFIPIYIYFMGIEAYGLVGFFATLLSVFVLLEMGLSSTLNRELAKLSVQPGCGQQMRNLVRTLGLIYWAVAVLIAVVVIALSTYLSQRWVRVENLSPETVRQAVLLMGIAIGLQWPAGFYSGGLMGLQRQVLLNVINSALATLRGGGAILILWLISPTIQAFFIWQIIISGMQTLLLGAALWRGMPESKEKASFQMGILREVWRFATGMFGISFLGILLTQTDKILLSRMLSLEMFGYYSLAGVVSMSLYRLAAPLFISVYPRLTQLVTVNDQVALKTLYHQSCQLMSVMILPAAMVLAFFSESILLLWTQNSVTTEQTHVLVSLLVIGTALSGLMNLPYALQLAHGWTKLSFYVNLASVIVLVPLIFFMVKHFGAIGAAIVWVTLNLGYVLITIQLMHRRLIPKEKWSWYYQDVGIPMTAAVFISGTGRFLMAADLSSGGLFFYIVLVSIMTQCGAIFGTPATRILCKRKIAQIHNYLGV